MFFFIAHVTSLKNSSFGSSFACQQKTSNQPPSRWDQNQSANPKRLDPREGTTNTKKHLPRRIHGTIVLLTYTWKPTKNSMIPWDRYIYIRPRPMDPSWVLLWLIFVGKGCNWMKGWICFLITGVTLSKTERKLRTWKLPIPWDPCITYIWLIFMVNVGKYIPYMDPVGIMHISHLRFIGQSSQCYVYFKGLQYRSKQVIQYL